MMWERTSYVPTEAGTVILACTIVLWALLELPAPAADRLARRDARSPQRRADAGAQPALERRSAGRAAARRATAGRLGHAIEPAIAPLGFDWKIGVGMIGAFAAREVFVSTMGVVYGVGDDADEQRHRCARHPRRAQRDGRPPVYTPLVGLSLMVFFALACQCMSTLAVVRRETAASAGRVPVRAT